VGRVVENKTEQRQTPLQATFADHEGGSIALFRPGVRPSRDKSIPVASAQIEKMAQEARYRQYAASIQQAARLWASEEGSASSVAGELVRWISLGEDENLRDFAWRYQWHQTFDLPGQTLLEPADMVTFSADGSLHAFSLQGHSRWNLDKSQPQLISTLPRRPRIRTYSHSQTGRGAFATETEVFVIDLATGTEFCRLEAPSKVLDVSVSGDGHQVAAVLADHSALLWNVGTGHILHRFSVHDARPRRLLLAADGSLMISGHPDHTAVAFYSRTGLDLSFNARSTIRCTAISSDGGLAACSDSTGRVYILNSDRKLEGRPLEAQTTNVVALEFSPDGRFLASGGIDGLVKVWNLESRREVKRLKGHLGSILSLTFSPDGHALASSSRDGTVKIWQLDQTSEPEVVEGNLSRSQIAFSLDGFWVAVSGFPGSLWNRQDGSTYELSVQGYGLAISPDSTTLAAGDDRSVRFLDLTSRKIVERWNTGVVAATLAYSPDGEFLALGPGRPANYLPRSPSPIRIWNVRLVEEEFHLLGHDNTVGALSFSPDGKLLASAGHDGSLRVWSLALRKITQSFCSSTPVTSVVFSPDGLSLLSGDRSGVIRVRDLRTGEVVSTLTSHIARVDGLALSRDGRALASASWDHSVKLWNLGTGLELRSFREHRSWVRDVAFAPDGNTLLSAGYDGAICLRQAADPSTVDSSPLTYWALYHRAKELIGQDRVEDAVATLEMVITHQRKLLGPHHDHTLVSMDALADAYLDQGSYEKAGPLYASVLSARRMQWPQGTSATGTLLYRTALAERGLGHLEPAAELASESIQVLGNHRDATHSRLLLASILLGQSTPESVAAAETVLLPAAGHDSAVMHALGDICDAMGRVGDAAAWHARGAELGGDLQGALAFLNQAITQDQEQASLYSQRAGLLAQSGRYEEAALDYSSFAEWDLEGGGDADVWFRGSLVLAKVGNRDDYSVYCELMLERFRDTEDPAAARVVTLGALIAPSESVDFVTTTSLAEVAASSESWQDVTGARLAKALAAYRQAEFEIAISQCNKVIREQRSQSEAVIAHLVIAGCFRGMGTTVSATREFDKAHALYMDLNSTDFEYLAIECLLAEIQAALQSQRPRK
jgi:WD40 repeat protein